VPDRDHHDPDPVHAALVVSIASIVWTLAAGTVALWSGIAARSVALSAFAGTGALDAAGSAALVVAFSHTLRHGAPKVAHERRARRLIEVGLATVGAATAISAALRLVGHDRTHEPTVGLVVAGASVVVLGVLSWRKRVIAHRVKSRALLADGALSAVGCLVAVITLAGTAAAASFGWWWVDPVAALGVAAVAVLLPFLLARAASRAGTA
jgi:divalent metal cation (Fe/Co/Zn/Cd) transporter